MASAKAAAPVRKDAGAKWYNPKSLLSQRVPVGFAVHMGFMYVLRHHRIFAELTVIPLIWWEVRGRAVHRASAPMRRPPPRSPLALRPWPPTVPVAAPAGARVPQPAETRHGAPVRTDPLGHLPAGAHGHLPAAGRPRAVPPLAFARPGTRRTAAGPRGRERGAGSLARAVLARPTALWGPRPPQFYAARLAVFASLGAATGVKAVDNITLNYLVIGLTCVLFLLSHFPIELMMAISMAVAGSDGFQYFAGKMFGRTKIVPKISPNKSLEGYVIAVAICNAVYFGYLGKYDVLTPPEAAVFVNGMLLAGILGDLSISWWKRNHMIKDTSSLLMAHGGLLDRLDSHIGAWVWTVAYWAYKGFPVGVNFIGMDYDKIVVLITITWTVVWAHFILSRLF